MERVRGCYGWRKQSRTLCCCHRGHFAANDCLYNVAQVKKQSVAKPCWMISSYQHVSVAEATCLTHVYCVKGRKEVNIAQNGGKYNALCTFFSQRKEWLLLYSCWLELGKHLQWKWFGNCHLIIVFRKDRFSSFVQFWCFLQHFSTQLWFYKKTRYQRCPAENTMSALSADVQWGISSVSHIGGTQHTLDSFSALWCIALYLTAGQIHSYQAV